jgi:hypothetical protein
MNRCPSCSSRYQGAVASCPICGFQVTPPLWDDEAQRADAGERFFLENSNTLQLPAWRGGAPVVATTQPASDNKTGILKSLLLPPAANVTGRIIAAEQMFQEEADLDVCRVLTRCLWFALLIISPFLVIYWLLVNAGGFSALLALIVFLVLLRFITPANLFSLVHLSAMLNPLRRNEANGVPVRYFRVRDQAQGDEFIIRVKGRYTAANLAPDDLVTFDGKWKDGVLRARRAYNFRTRAFVRLRESSSWLALCATLIVIGSLILAFRKPVVVLVQKIESLQTP